jgi:hypothetical protein
LVDADTKIYYNIGVMKIIIKLPAQKQRLHQALFDNDLPFQPRKQPSQKQYKRQPKHKKSQDRDEY